MKPLPKGWEWARVDEVGRVQLGRQRSPQHHAGEHMRPYLRVANVFENRIDVSDVMQMNFTPEEFERYALQGGDILLNEGQSRELVGRPAMFNGEVPGACFQNTLIRFRANDTCLPRYALAVFRHFFHSGDFERVCKWTTNIAHLGAERFASMPFPLAPVPEQRRIADKLDSVLARVDACREHLNRVPAILKQFRQAVVASAAAGTLTSDLRYDLGAEWPERRLSTLCQADRVITYGVIKLGDDVEDGTPCLRTSNVRWLKVETEGVKRIRPSLSAEYGRTVLRGGEVLVNVRGTLGGVAVVTQEMAGWNVSREVAVIPADQAVLSPNFLALWVASDQSQRWLGSVEKGVAYTGINIEDLRNLPVRVPPIPEQTEIVRRVESLFAWADRLETRLTAAREQTDRLTPSLLAKAFRGELVPQDPGDGPAAELLARVLQSKPDSGAGRPRRGRHPSLVE